MIDAKELELLISLYGGSLSAIIDSTVKGDWIDFFKPGEMIQIQRTVRDDDIISSEDPDTKNLYGIVFFRLNSNSTDTFYLDENDKKCPISIVHNKYLEEYLNTNLEKSYVNFLEEKIYELEKDKK